MTETGQKLVGEIYLAPVPPAAVHSRGGDSVVVIDYYSLFAVALIVCGGCV